MINGAIVDLGKTFAITVQAVNCKNGATLAREQVQAEGREQVLECDLESRRRHPPQTGRAAQFHSEAGSQPA